MAAHSRYWALLWPTYPAQPILSWLVTSAMKIAMEFCWQTLNPWSKIVMLVLPQSIFSRFSFQCLFIFHQCSLLAEQWNRKREQKASFDVWTEQRVTYVGEHWALSALLLFCHIAAGFKLLALLPTRLCVKARPSHHCFYHYNVF